MLDNKTLEKLSQPKLRHFAPYLAFDWIGMAAAMLVFHAHPSVVAFIGATLVLGLLQHALAVLGHEAVHFRVCENRIVNEWIGNLLCFFPVGMTVSAYREFHFPHHRDPYGTGDPEVSVRRAIRGFAPPFTLARGLRIWALSYLGFSLRDLALFVRMIPPGQVDQRRALALFWAAVLAGVYATGTWAYLGLWVASLATTYFTTFQIQGWYEHGLAGLPACRYRIPSWLFRVIVPHNIWIHYEHHKYPSVPFYNLPKVRALDYEHPVQSLDELVTALHASNAQPVAKLAA